MFANVQSADSVEVIPWLQGQVSGMGGAGTTSACRVCSRCRLTRWLLGHVGWGLRLVCTLAACTLVSMAVGAGVGVQGRLV
jgi:hypothetical protein